MIRAVQNFLEGRQRSDAFEALVARAGDAIEAARRHPTADWPNQHAMHRTNPDSHPAEAEVIDLIISLRTRADMLEAQLQAASVSSAHALEYYRVQVAGLEDEMESLSRITAQLSDEDLAQFGGPTVDAEVVDAVLARVSLVDYTEVPSDVEEHVRAARGALQELVVDYRAQAGATARRGRGLWLMWEEFHGRQRTGHPRDAGSILGGNLSHLRTDAIAPADGPDRVAAINLAVADLEYGLQRTSELEAALRRMIDPDSCAEHSIEQ